MKIKFSSTKQIDPQRIQEMIRSVGWGERNEQDILLSLANSYYAVFAWDADLLIGMGRVVSDGVYSATVWDLVVRPEYQGRQIGSVILQHLIAYLQKQQFNMVMLFSAPGKQGFYQRHGFQENHEGITGLLLTMDTQPARAIPVVDYAVMQTS